MTTWGKGSKAARGVITGMTSTNDTWSQLNFKIPGG